MQFLLMLCLKRCLSDVHSTQNKRGGIHMKCPYCGKEDSRVMDSRPTDDGSIRRRRQCDSCGKRFTTYEKVETVPLMVIKKDSKREPYEDRKSVV